MRQEKALVIGTEVATSQYESGASLRLQTIKSLLEQSGFEVTVVSRSLAKQKLKTNWDAIALVSFPTAKFSRSARKHTKFLWLDSTDSWTLTRVSQIKSGQVIQLLPYIRDLFYLWTAPKLDLITFISKRDAAKEKLWWKNRNTPLVFPVFGLTRKVTPSTQPRLVFIGDGNYGPNKRAFEFLQQIAPFLPKESPIHVYGKGFPESAANFVFHGYTEPSEIYFTQDIHLAPIFDGAGLKLKIAVPLGNQLQVITTTEGSMGFNLGPNLLIADSKLDWHSAIIQLLNSLKSSNSRDHHPVFCIDESLQVTQILKSAAESNQ